VLGVVVPVDVLAGRSLHSDQVADLNERSTRRGTPGGQSGEAITGRKLRAIPGAPGCPARYEHAETIKKIGKSDPLEPAEPRGVNFQDPLTGPGWERARPTSTAIRYFGVA
jgi:hypothetical protein